MTKVDFSRQIALAIWFGLFFLISCSETPIETQDEVVPTLNKVTVPTLTHWNTEYGRKGIYYFGDDADDMDFWLSFAPQSSRITVEAVGDGCITLTKTSNTQHLAPLIEPDFIPFYYWVEAKVNNIWYDVAEGYCNEYDVNMSDTESIDGDYKSQINQVKSNQTINSCMAYFWVDVLQPDDFHLKITAKGTGKFDPMIVIIDEDYHFDDPIWERIKRMNASYSFENSGTYTITYALSSPYYFWTGTERSWPIYTTTTTRTLTVLNNCYQ